MPFRLYRLALSLLIGLGIALPAEAQKYRTAAGVRIGSGNYGFTAQQRIFEKTTLEGLALFGSREATGTLLIERHFPLLGPSLNYYFGAGAHLGHHKDYGTIGGFDGLVGLEWKLPITPLLVSVDFKPSYEINNDDWFRFPSAVSLRYVLIKEKKKPFMNGIFGGGEDDKGRSRSKSESRKNRSERKPSLFEGIFGN